MLDLFLLDNFVSIVCSQRDHCQLVPWGRMLNICKIKFTWGSWWYHNIQSFHTLCGKVSWWEYDISFRFSQDTHLNKQTLGYTYIIYIPWWHCDTHYIDHNNHTVAVYWRAPLYYQKAIVSTCTNVTLVWCRWQ